MQQPSADPITALRGIRWKFADRAQCMGCGYFTERLPKRVLYTCDGLYYHAHQSCLKCGCYSVRLRVLDLAEDEPPEDDIPVTADAGPWNL